MVRSASSNCRLTYHTSQKQNTFVTKGLNLFWWHNHWVGHGCIRCCELVGTGPFHPLTWASVQQGSCTGTLGHGLVHSGNPVRHWPPAYGAHPCEKCAQRCSVPWPHPSPTPPEHSRCVLSPSIVGKVPHPGLCVQLSRSFSIPAQHYYTD